MFVNWIIGTISEETDEMRTYYISIRKAEPGMILAKDVYTHNDQLILNKGTVLDAMTIAKISMYSIDGITIAVDEDAERQIDKRYSTYTARLMETMEFREFASRYDKMVSELEAAFVTLSNSTVNELFDKITSEIEDMMPDKANRRKYLEMLHCIKSYDDATFSHSMNVAILTDVFAAWLGFSDNDRKSACFAGALHDVGKTQIDKDLLNKQGKLTTEEFQKIKDHPLLGYNMIKGFDIDEEIKLAVLQHHERFDGTGYPYGIAGAAIGEYARLVAIADVYDAMTSNRVYRNHLCPFDVIRNFEFDDRLKYAPELLTPLLSQIAETYIHHTVRLSNSKEGEVILINRSELSKPIVKIDESYIDLSKRRSLTIADVL